MRICMYVGCYSVQKVASRIHLLSSHNQFTVSLQVCLSPTELNLYEFVCRRKFSVAFINLSLEIDDLFCILHSDGNSVR